MDDSRPRVILSAAISVDGRIATSGGDSNLSSESDRRRVHAMRSRADAILIGRNTLRRDDPLLTTRLAEGKNPVRVVLDSRGTIPSGSRILKTCGEIPTIIAVTSDISERNMRRLARLPVDVMACGTGEVDLRDLLVRLRRRGIRSLLVEGGGTVNWSLAKLGLIDEVVVTVTPYLLGGRGAVSLVEGSGFSGISDAVGLSLKRVSKNGDELVLEYVVAGSGK